MCLYSAQNFSHLEYLYKYNAQECLKKPKQVNNEAFLLHKTDI